MITAAHDLTASVVLVGVPGAGCSSVSEALGGLTGAPVADLAAIVAGELGTTPELALVAVPEARYREVESATALALLSEATARPGVVALGSGCLADEDVVVALDEVRGAGGRVVALTASTRRLSTRNGLDAPRSVGLGNVHHEFVQALHAREARCREVADAVVDTSETTPVEAAQTVLAA